MKVVVDEKKRLACEEIFLVEWTSGLARVLVPLRKIGMGCVVDLAPQRIESAHRFANDPVIIPMRIKRPLGQLDPSVFGELAKKGKFEKRSGINGSLHPLILHVEGLI